MADFAYNGADGGQKKDHTTVPYRQIPGYQGNIGSLVESSTSMHDTNAQHSQSFPQSFNNYTENKSAIDNTLMVGRHETTSDTDIVPVQYFCGGTTVKSGLRALTVVALLDTMLLLFLAARPLNKEDEADKNVDVYFALGYVILIPVFLNLLIQIRWLLRDTMLRRKYILTGYKIHFATIILFSLWQLIGCQLLLGSTFSEYMVTNYPGYIGYDSTGTCINAGMCSLGTTINLQEEG